MHETLTLARFVAESHWSDIPQAMRHEAKRALLNWMGCALGGCHARSLESAPQASRRCWATNPISLNSRATSYIEAVRFADKLHCCIPRHITRLPLHGIAEVRQRFEQLMLELDTASKRLDDNSCMVIREGVHIFGAALSRLNVLDEQHYMPQRMTAAAVGFEAHAAFGL